MRLRRAFDRVARVAAGLACLAACGCSEELGPEVIPSTTASGVVLASGRPVSRGWVELHPVDGTLGVITTARIGPDGRFRFDRAPVGEVVVRLSGAPLGDRNLIPLLRSITPIRRRTTSPEGAPMTIDVDREILRDQVTRGARR